MTSPNMRAFRTASVSMSAAHPDAGSVFRPLHERGRSGIAVCRRADRYGAVHRVHAGSAAGDAITNALLLIRRVLPGMGQRDRRR